MTDTSPISPIPPVPGQHVTRPPKKDYTLLWTALSLVIAISVLLAVSAIDDTKGEPWIANSLVGQAIATLGLVAAGFGPLLVKVTKDTAAVKHEVKNDHSSNMRVESDVRFDRTIRYFERLEGQIDRLDGKVDRVDARLDRDEQGTATRLDRLEKRLDDGGL